MAGCRCSGCALTEGITKSGAESGNRSPTRADSKCRRYASSVTNSRNNPRPCRQGRACSGSEPIPSLSRGRAGGRRSETDRNACACSKTDSLSRGNANAGCSASSDPRAKADGSRCREPRGAADRSNGPNTNRRGLPGSYRYACPSAGLSCGGRSRTEPGRKTIGNRARGANRQSG